MKMIKLSKFFAALIIAGVMSTSSVFAVNAAVADNELGYLPAFKSEDTLIAAEKESDLPLKYSSVDYGYVTAIKNQKYDDCWAYAGVSAYESKLLRSGKAIGNVSVDHANLWATKNLDGKGWQRNYKGGGYSNILPGYFASWYGGIFESDIPTVNFSENLYGDDAQKNRTKYGTTSIRYLSKLRPDEIKQAIMDNGGVCTSYVNVSSFVNNVSYYMPPTYNGNVIGHSVEVVGWDDEYSRSRFNVKPKNNGAWLVRNSWGDYNSLGGYFWISYEDKNIFGSKFNPSYTFEDFIEVTDDIKLKQNEIYGATYEFRYVITDDISYINTFDFSDEYNVLDKVIFESKCVGADYDVFYLPLENNIPDYNKENWVKLDSGKIEFEGYHCVDFEDFEVPDTKGAIAVEINTSFVNEGKVYNQDDSYVVNSLGVCEWLQTVSGDYTFLNNAKKGDSFISYRGVSTDLLDWYKDKADDEIGGTFVIKAVTKNKSDNYLFGDVNLDGELTIDDATLLQKYIAEISELSDEALRNADTDNNSKIEISDVTNIQKALAGLLEQ